MKQSRTYENTVFTQKIIDLYEKESEKGTTYSEEYVLEIIVGFLLLKDLAYTVIKERAKIQTAVLPSLEYFTIDLWDKNFTFSEDRSAESEDLESLLHLEEYKKLWEQREVEKKERLKYQEMMRQVDQDQRDRWEYERLKKKFGDSPSSIPTLVG